MNKAKKTLSNCTIEEGKSIDWEDIDAPQVFASFDMSILDLYKNIQDQSVAQVILNFMDENQFIISPRNRYLLQYWDYEATMIVRGESNYKSWRTYECSHLSSPILLNAILDECEKKKYVPGFQQLFQFLERSEKMKGDYLNPSLYICTPFKLAFEEVQQFIKINENNLLGTESDRRIHGKYHLFLFDKKLTKVFEDYASEQKTLQI
ncbi:hypothetical protein [Legionella sp. WA2022007384]